MRVNLTSTPVWIERPGLAEGLRDAISQAMALTGVKHFTDFPDVVKEDKLHAELASLNDLSRKKGPVQSTAAAALATLAIEGYVMLSAAGRPIFRLTPPSYELKLPPFLAAVEDCLRILKPEGVLKRTHLQIILATDCRRAADFDIEDYALLHDWLMDMRAIKRTVSLAAPVCQLLRVIETTGETGLSQDLRHAYILWRASEYDKKMDFKEFMSDPNNRVDMRIHGNERERIELKEDINLRQTRESERKRKLRIERPQKSFIENLHQIARDDAVTAPEDYFEALSGSGPVKGFRPEAWLENPINYPGREFVKISEIGSNWFIAFRAFLSHRKKSYETDGQARTTLHLLADYLLLYLPWWMELHPETSLVFPASPKQFVRYLYVDRMRFNGQDPDGIELLPKTLYDLFPLRLPTPGSRNTARLALQQFFSFVLTYFEDNFDFVGKGMKSPIRIDFDNEVAGRRTKTDKIPFTEDVFPFLVNYGQAVEAFGEFLQQEAYVKNCFKKLPYGAIVGYNTAEWGYVPIFRYRGRLYRIDWIPNIFLISKRTLQSNPSGKAGLYVNGSRINVGINRCITLNFPSLTTVRLLTAMVETGLRAQSIQWLDRRSFDRLALPIASLAALYGNPEAQNFHSLYVNTDKAHDEWKNFISWRVRRSFLAECYFQESVVDKFQSILVDYEDREHSRFDPVMALFRSDRNSKPISDGMYSSRWVDLLYGFQSFFNRKDGVDRTGSEDELILLKERDWWEEGAPINEIYLAIHTPHACRATYATLKDGDLEITEIAEQLGHSNTVVTSTYQVPQINSLLKKLKDIDARTMSVDICDVAGESQAYLHPEHQGSSVRAAFEKNREQAIVDFGFVPGVALWSLSELDGDTSTLELLRQSPSSVIRWHPTHVCPVGNQCPREVVANSGGTNRCGLCPLAAKCIDHLPAIEAKQRELLERIRATTVWQGHLERQSAPQPEIDALHRERALDTKEFLGWKLSAEILRTRQRELGEDSHSYHVDQPELVRKQLELVTRDRTESEFFLQRIEDSNALPSLESPEVRARALRYSRLILAQQGRFKEAAFLDVPPHSETTVFASLVKPYLEAKGLSLEQLGAALEEVSRVAALPAATDTPLLAGV